MLTVVGVVTKICMGYNGFILLLFEKEKGQVWKGPLTIAPSRMPESPLWKNTGQNQPCPFRFPLLETLPDSLVQ